MEVKEVESNDLDRQCQAVSPNDEPCVYPATVHCAKCGRWFRDSSLADSPLLAGTRNTFASASGRTSQKSFPIRSFVLRSFLFDLIPI